MPSAAPRLALLAMLAVSAAFPAAAQGPLKPIPKAGNWILADELSTARGCAAMLPGDDLNVNMLETSDGHVLLVASRPDWKFTPAKVNFRFQVDQAPDRPIEGNVLANLVVTPVDAALETALFSAKEVTWKLPGAEYRVEVRGLKTAFAALKACNVRKGVKR